MWGGGGTSFFLRLLVFELEIMICDVVRDRFAVYSKYS